MTREIGSFWLVRKNTSRSAAAHHAVLLALVPLILVGCRMREADRPVFKLLSPDETGVRFANTIITSDTFNIQNDVYIYNGAGVGVGDIDNDGLPDIFFAGNMVSSRLYVNRGEMRFEDITERAGVTTKRWATGVAMVDINNDGYLDIYVSVSGPASSKAQDRANLLFVNNKNRTFTDAAAQYGIADTSFTTQAVFLDYNRDGCLDLFLLNNSPKDFTRGVTNHPTAMPGTTPGSYNELYRNDCHGHFTNVSQQAGILRVAGYGLGVVVADMNGDGWPDIYVSNDGVPNDVLYINNRDGTFTDKAGKWVKHTSQAGMGVDIADFNNDGWPDILQVDMMPRDLARRKRMSGFMSYGNLTDNRARGFRDDYSQNVLQLSNGITSDGGLVFSEISRLAGVSHTDWSWSALFADFDNDGNKDIFIGNGYPKAVNDLDYMNAANAARRRGDTRRALALLKDLPPYAETSYVFRNNGDLTFTDESRRWGINKPGFSYGAAYADLNNDGKLDLVVNNIDSPAFVYENVAPTDDAHHYLEVRLLGNPPRQMTAGIGAELMLFAGGERQDIYYSPYRGFMSTMDDRAHFGLSRATRADSLRVDWPDGGHQTLRNVSADRLLVVRQADATQPAPGSAAPAVAAAAKTGRWFAPLELRGLQYKPPSASLVDYNIQPLLPYMISRHGPPIAVADVNGDGLEDVFIGGGDDVAGRLFLQQKDGSFVESAQGQPWEADKNYEDWGATFFDANGDARPDLYVASGSYRVAPTSAFLQDRLYINEGGGKFVRDVRALPTMLTSTAVVRAGDFNGDGRPDLFIGGRLTPLKYPYPTRSYILRNDGDHFTDVTSEVAPELIQPGGMITDAQWVDFDGDGRLDLVTVGEWMPIQFFRNEGKRLRDVTAETKLPPLRGWWYSLAVGDFDKDGRPDLVAGNLGLNYTYTTFTDSVFGVYASNFSGSQSTDIVLTQKLDGTEYPIAGMSPLGRDIYTLGIRFPTYGSFANVSMGEAFGEVQLKQALHYTVDTFASVFLHNEGGGKFSSDALPNLAQISPVRGIIAHDVDGDGNLDLILAGNLYDTEANTARADAGNGVWLKGDGKGRFVAIPPVESGFLAPRDVAELTLINTPAGKAVVISNIGDSLQAFRLRKR
jgi:hypothetical protein